MKQVWNGLDRRSAGYPPFALAALSSPCSNSLKLTLIPNSSDNQRSSDHQHSFHQRRKNGHIVFGFSSGLFESTMKYAGDANGYGLRCRRRLLERTEGVETQLTAWEMV
jgi:hypothetical protein